MIFHKKRYKQSYSNFHFENFKKTRNEYFHEIRKLKKACWIDFLEKTIEKNVFWAYKFTKGNRVEKLPPINHKGQTCINFDQKCNAFVDAMFSTPSNIEISTNKSINFDYSTKKCMATWPILTESEIQSAIFTSAPKKAPKPNNLTFLIIQNAYKCILKLFFLLYSKLINNGIYLNC